ncbi:MAG: hypothetical protein QF712_05665 [Candidatus Marinimicrobia bacterium]|jgi:hypothetical protein|nr:hypothetical protein [Candidatus Neomarinimicrobiota bacterium]MDP7526760.1 hypothetical protein [Candidatus Neomarinimicrobiota bacterium]|tara:strand:+ start:84 stop:479 length:396 start_codon:yes stop_codon:yes gene_type:complete
MSFYNAWKIDLKSKQEFTEQEYADIFRSIKEKVTDPDWMMKDVLESISHEENKLVIDTCDRIEARLNYWYDLDKIIQKITELVSGGWESNGKYIWSMDDGDWNGDTIWEVEENGVRFIQSEVEYDNENDDD